MRKRGIAPESIGLEFNLYDDLEDIIAYDELVLILKKLVSYNAIENFDIRYEEQALDPYEPSIIQKYYYFRVWVSEYFDLYLKELIDELDIYIKILLDRSD